MHSAGLHHHIRRRVTISEKVELLTLKPLPLLVITYHRFEKHYSKENNRTNGDWFTHQP
jgi:hypothetical protein